jgi:hypothetical protein
MIVGILMWLVGGILLGRDRGLHWLVALSLHLVPVLGILLIIAIGKAPTPHEAWARQNPGLDEARRLVDGIAGDALGVADHRARVQGHPELHAEGVAGRLVVLPQRGGQVAEGLGRHRSSRRIRGDHDQGPIAAILLMEVSPR